MRLGELGPFGVWADGCSALPVLTCHPPGPPDLRSPVWGHGSPFCFRPERGILLSHARIGIITRSIFACKLYCFCSCLRIERNDDHRVAVAYSDKPDSHRVTALDRNLGNSAASDLTTCFDGDDLIIVSHHQASD